MRLDAVPRKFRYGGARMKMEKDPEWMRAVGNRLDVLARALGKTQADLARVLVISPQRLNNYVRGARPFDLDLAMLLCERFGCTLDYLYMGKLQGLPFWLNQRVAELEGRVGHTGGDDHFKN